MNKSYNFDVTHVNLGMLVFACLASLLLADAFLIQCVQPLAPEVALKDEEEGKQTHSSN